MGKGFLAMRLSRVLIVTALVMAPTARATGQASIRTVIGQVRSTAGRSLAGAQIVVTGDSAHSVFSDSAGSFRLTGVSVQSLALLVRLPGFTPATVAVPAGTEVAIVANVTLTPTATRLPDLVTKAASNPRLVDFERRRRSGFGTFLGPEEVTAKGAMHTAELLRGIPGVRVRIGPPGVEDLNSVSFARCPQGGVTVWIDGAKLRPDGGKFSPASVALMLERINPHDILAIEIHRGVASLPVEFIDDSCAAIAIWTR